MLCGLYIRTVCARADLYLIKSFEVSKGTFEKVPLAGCRERVPAGSRVKPLHLSPRSFMYILVTILVIVGLVVFDQVTKLLVVANIPLYESVDLIPGVFRFTYIQNDGAAFGIFDDAPWVFMILSTVAIIAIFVYIFWKKPQDKLMLSALILINAGGIGNMIDRVRLEYVIDFLDFCAFPELWKWVFNIADSYVCIGAGLLLLWMILDTVKEIKAEKARKLAAANGAVTENGDKTDA